MIYAEHCFPTGIFNLGTRQTEVPTWPKPPSHCPLIKAMGRESLMSFPCRQLSTHVVTTQSWEIYCILCDSTGTGFLEAGVCFPLDVIPVLFSLWFCFVFFHYNKSQLCSPLYHTESRGHFSKSFFYTLPHNSKKRGLCSEIIFWGVLNISGVHACMTYMHAPLALEIWSSGLVQYNMTLKACSQKHHHSGSKEAQLHISCLCFGRLHWIPWRLCAVRFQQCSKKTQV